VGFLEPIRRDEKLPEAAHPGIVELIDHVGLLHDRRVDLPDAIIDGRDTGVVVRTDATMSIGAPGGVRDRTSSKNSFVGVPNFICAGTIFPNNGV